MKKIFVLTSWMGSKELSFLDAFVDYLDDKYFPMVADELDQETIQFEYEYFLNTYAK